MALFSAIGDSFVAKILKQVAHDYKLDYEEMKSRYCGKSSYEYYESRAKQSVTVDLEEVAEEAPKKVLKGKAPKVAEESPKVAEEAPKVAEAPEAPKKVLKGKAPPKIPSGSDDPIDSLTSSMSSLAVAPASSEVLPLSKMKKRDLEIELERRGLCPDGTIPELKDRLKHARLLEKPVKKARKPKDPNAPKKDPNAPKKERKAKEPKTPPNSPAKSTPVPPAPVKAPKPVEPEEEEEEADDRMDLADDQEFMDEMDEEEDDRMNRLRAMLADAGECEEEEYDDE
jgi:hypothetical protein